MICISKITVHAWIISFLRSLLISLRVTCWGPFFCYTKLLLYSFVDLFSLFSTETRIRIDSSCMSLVVGGYHPCMHDIAFVLAHGPLDVRIWCVDKT